MNGYTSIIRVVQDSEGKDIEHSPGSLDTFVERIKSGAARGVPPVGGLALVQTHAVAADFTPKYHEGKVKRTLERELKVPEIAEWEANGTSVSW